MSSATPNTASLVQCNYLPDIVYEKAADGSEFNVESLKTVVCAIVEHARDVSSADMQVSVITGGITNQLYKVAFTPSPAGDYRAPVLVRIFGAEGMIDRDLENATYQALAEAGVGPGYHGRFSKGRVEVFLEGMLPLTLDDMGSSVVSPKIAVEMGRLHQWQMPEPLQPFYSTPSLWSQLWSWLEQARDDVGAGKLSAWGPAVETRFQDVLIELVGPRFERAESAIRSLEAACGSSLVVFCNNDLLAGNILFDKTTGKLQLIDFEYGGGNYRGFEIANHWNEWAGGTQTEMNGRTEYNRFPSSVQQRDFCRVYLEAGAADASSVSDSMVDQLLTEAQSFVPVNHWYWGLWAVNQAVAEGVDSFDYLTYAECRLRRFYEIQEAVAEHAKTEAEDNDTGALPTDSSPAQTAQSDSGCAVI